MKEFYRSMRDYAKVLYEEALEKDLPTAEHYKQEMEHYQEQYYAALDAQADNA